MARKYQERDSLDDFRRVWIVLAKRSKCDTWGSVECIRVFNEWTAEGRPLPISRFISQRANQPPPAVRLDGADRS